MAMAIGVGVDGFVGAGVGVIREASSGSSEAHPVLSNNPAKTINPKIRDIATN